MFNTLSKTAAAVLLTCGVMSAQADSLGTLGSAKATASFEDTLPKNQNDIFSNFFSFKIETGYAGTVVLDHVGSALAFENAFLETKVKGSWKAFAADSNNGDGLFSSLAAGTYRVRFEFDTANVRSEDKRSFSGFVTAGVPSSVTAVPEPQSFAMFLAGLGILGAIARRRKQS